MSEGGAATTRAAKMEAVECLIDPSTGARSCSVVEGVDVPQMRSTGGDGGIAARLQRRRCDALALALQWAVALAQAYRERLSVLDPNLLMDICEERDAFGGDFGGVAATAAMAADGGGPCATPLELFCAPAGAGRLLVLYVAVWAAENWREFSTAGDAGCEALLRAALATPSAFLGFLRSVGYDEFAVNFAAPLRDLLQHGLAEQEMAVLATFASSSFSDPASDGKSGPGGLLKDSVGGGGRSGRTGLLGSGGGSSVGSGGGGGGTYNGSSSGDFDGGGSSDRVTGGYGGCVRDGDGKSDGHGGYGGPEDCEWADGPMPPPPYASTDSGAAAARAAATATFSSAGMPMPAPVPVPRLPELSKRQSSMYHFLPRRTVISEAEAAEAGVADVSRAAAAAVVAAAAGGASTVDVPRLLGGFADFLCLKDFNQAAIEGKPNVYTAWCCRVGVHDRHVLLTALVQGSFYYGCIAFIGPGARNIQNRGDYAIACAFLIMIFSLVYLVNSSCQQIFPNLVWALGQARNLRRGLGMVLHIAMDVLLPIGIVIATATFLRKWSHTYADVILNGMAAFFILDLDGMFFERLTEPATVEAGLARLITADLQHYASRSSSVRISVKNARAFEIGFTVLINLVALGCFAWALAVFWLDSVGGYGEGGTSSSS